MKNASKIIIILLIILICIGIAIFIKNEKNSTTDSTTNATVNTENYDTSEDLEDKIDKKQILLDVMNNKQKFTDEDNNEVFLKDFKIVENQTAKVDKYAFVDLDNDDIQELVIYTTSDYGAYVILHYENNKVYGYMIEVRSLENLKSDGSFMASSGAEYIEYLRMNFNKNSYSTKTEAVYNGNDNVYQINGKNVSEEEIKEYTEIWNKKTDVIWSK